MYRPLLVVLLCLNLGGCAFAVGAALGVAAVDYANTPPEVLRKRDCYSDCEITCPHVDYDRVCTPSFCPEGDYCPEDCRTEEVIDYPACRDHIAQCRAWCDGELDGLDELDTGEWLETDPSTDLETGPIKK